MEMYVCVLTVHLHLHELRCVVWCACACTCVRLVVVVVVVVDKTPLFCIMYHNTIPKTHLSSFVLLAVSFRLVEPGLDVLLTVWNGLVIFIASLK